MDKYEYKLRSDEIKSLIKQREFQKAVEIADTIDWTRVRSVTTLCTISDLYKINRRYRDAKILLEQAYEYVDYISLHQYFNKKDGSTEDFFASIDNLDTFIDTVSSICDEVKASKGSDKTVYLSFDEWNCWYHTLAEDDARMKNDPWGLAPHLLEDDYTFEDAIVNGLALIKFINHSDRVKIACLAQLVNVLSPITTTDNGVFKQTIFYPFMQSSRYGRGEVLNTIVKVPTYESKHGDAPYVDSVVISDEENGALTVFAVNKNLEDDFELTCDLRQFSDYKVEFQASNVKDCKEIQNQFE